MKQFYRPFSGLHEHHIVPKHSGGSNDESNLTYLTISEHILAHFMLWKIYKNTNDLRAMKMLGAKLSTKYRKEIGYYCRDNKIGFHGVSSEDKSRWRKKGLDTQSNSNSKNTFTYWSSSDGRKERASLGGKVGGKVTYDMKIGIHDPSVQKEAAIKGGKSHTGKWWIYNDIIDRTTRCFPHEIENYISQGWTRKYNYTTNKGKKFGPSVNRRKVTDGITIYESVLSAAISCGVTSGAIIGRCKENSKFTNWKYVS
jgi:hypothetical protein